MCKPQKQDDGENTEKVKIRPRSRSWWVCVRARPPPEPARLLFIDDATPEERSRTNTEV